jgi:hypothetical protein
MLLLAQFCNEELRTRTELPARGVVIQQQLTYSLDIHFLQRFMLARFIVTSRAGLGWAGLGWAVLCDPFVS